MTAFDPALRQIKKTIRGIENGILSSFQYSVSSLLLQEMSTGLFYRWNHSHTNDVNVYFVEITKDEESDIDSL